MQINNLILELNADCNSNCIYCYLLERKGSDDHSIRYFKSMLLDLSHRGIRNVDFTGGEPTLYRQLPELIAYASHLGYQNRTLVTNGRMLSYREYLERLKSSGLNRAVVSLDGHNAKTAEAITRSPGSFAQTQKAFRNLKKLGITTGATVVINKLNYRHIGAVMKKAIDLKADFLNIQFMLPHVLDRKVSSRRLSSSIIPKYSEVRPYITKALKEHEAGIKTNIHFIPFCQLKGFERFLDMEAQKDDRYALNYRGFGYNIGEHLKKGAIKGECCKNCRYNKRCIGFFISYARELGVEKHIRKELQMKHIQKMLEKMENGR